MVQSFTKKQLSCALILFVIATCYLACTKTNTKPAVNNTPVTISSISVNSGTYNTVVIITGTSFDTTPANDKVFFNGKAATVSAATATQLTVAVPLNAGTGNVTLSVNNGALVSGPVFTYYTPPTISSISVNSGPYNTVVIITGTGFDTTPANDKVSFNGKAAIVSAATATQITVAVPLGAGTGNITLSVNNLTPISGPLFTYQYTPMVTWLAGNATQGSANGTGTSATFNYPTGVTADAAGNVYVADYGNNLIRKITSAGVVTTFAGSGNQALTDGTGTSASFFFPYGVAADAAGNVYVADYGTNAIRKITVAGVVTTLAGSGASGSANGTGAAASFRGPSSVAVDAAGNIYVADLHNHLIRKITTAGVVTTLAGSGTAGSTDGTGTSASFNYPSGVAVDAAGNIYVADSGNNLIRKITSLGVVTTFAGNGTAGSANGTGTSASFNNPAGVAVDATGNLYVADYLNNLIRKITAAGVVTTFAGTGTRGAANGIGASASFNGPMNVAVDVASNVYVADSYNHLIREIALK